MSNLGRFLIIKLTPSRLAASFPPSILERGMVELDKLEYKIFRGRVRILI